MQMTRPKHVTARDWIFAFVGESSDHLLSCLLSKMLILTGHHFHCEISYLPLNEYVLVI